MKVYCKIYTKDNSFTETLIVRALSLGHATKKLDRYTYRKYGNINLCYHVATEAKLISQNEWWPVLTMK